MEKEELERKYGQLWNTKELQEEFEVISFWAPTVTVIRKLDNQRGTMEFQHFPRYYYSFIPNSQETI